MSLTIFANIYFSFNIDNAKSSDNNYAAANPDIMFSATDVGVSIVKAGTISGTDQAYGASITSSDTYQAYGGISNKWGLTWTEADIENSGFGVAYRAGGMFYSDWLKATNFGFSINSTSIDGIVAEIERKATDIVYVDHIRITVYYTEGGGADPCTYSGTGDFNISQNCYITSNVYVNGAVNIIPPYFLDCAPGVKVSATEYNMGYGGKVNVNCKAFHY